MTMLGPIRLRYLSKIRLDTEENSLVEPRWVYADLLLDCLVWTSTVLVLKDELIRIGGFNEDLRKGQDYDLWLRLSRTVQMAYLGQVTALYRIHVESITHAAQYPML